MWSRSFFFFSYQVFPLGLVVFVLLPPTSPLDLWKRDSAVNKTGRRRNKGQTEEKRGKNSQFESRALLTHRSQMHYFER